MTTISIKDLPDSVELDRQAMAAIIGGARTGVRYSIVAQPVMSTARVVDYPPGFPGARHPIAEAIARR